MDNRPAGGLKLGKAGNREDSVVVEACGVRVKADGAAVKVDGKVRVKADGEVRAKVVAKRLLSSLLPRVQVSFTHKGWPQVDGNPKVVAKQLQPQLRVSLM